MKRVSRFLLCAAAFVLFQIATAPAALAAPILGTAGTFAVLAGSTVTNTGPTVLNGNLGVWPGTAITGFPPGSVTAPGTTHAGDAVAQQAQSDLTAAYNLLAGLAVNTVLTGQDLGGMTLTSGVYFFSSSAQLTGALTLNAQNNPNARFVFQIGSALTTASNSSVVFINNAGNLATVYWQVGSSATLGTTTAFQGNIAALTSITLNTGATMGCGGAYARNGAVTMDTNVISRGCDDTGSVIVPPGGDGGGQPPIPEPGTLALLGTGIAGLIARRRKLAPKA